MVDSCTLRLFGKLRIDGLRQSVFVRLLLLTSANRMACLRITQNDLHWSERLLPDREISHCGRSNPCVLRVCMKTGSMKTSNNLCKSQAFLRMTFEPCCQWMDLRIV
eukprot:Protomagalhaensia_wolfi_Nauph_80__4376@NODE_4472_length_562_cov_52_302103_g3578_i0_p1_GENE_NODE_4472_length_562_cov_52_302103_g3578_i0NODE_4472_length_562_cov_52_302103_g3578_i0_p1_ORF_typecomplete_len107_score6_36FerB/PF08150_12/0_00089_NODE_4472_length_562_cov_52_302103_g3578_i061381